MSSLRHQQSRSRNVFTRNTDESKRSKNVYETHWCRIEFTMILLGEILCGRHPESLSGFELLARNYGNSDRMETYSNVLRIYFQESYTRRNISKKSITTDHTIVAIRCWLENPSSENRANNFQNVLIIQVFDESSGVSLFVFVTESQ